MYGDELEGQLFIHLMKSWLSSNIWWWAGGSIFHPPDEILTIRMIVEIWTQKLMSWRVNFSATWWNIDYQAIYGDELEGQLFINLMKNWLSANTYDGELEGQFFSNLMKSWLSKDTCGNEPKGQFFNHLMKPWLAKGNQCKIYERKRWAISMLKFDLI